jgi:ADP-ribose pyrophosphatase
VLPGRSIPEEFHSLRQSDYVSILAVTRDGRVPLVRQYRPAVERMTLELPGGLRENDDTPEATAERELVEETGLNLVSPLFLLGCLAPDTGRLENRLWGYFAQTEAEEINGWEPEPEVERLLVPRRELRDWILTGQFDHALHIALIGLAVMHGVIGWD